MKLSGSFILSAISGTANAQIGSDPFMLSMMLGDNSNINPFMMSLLSDNKNKMDPMTLMMLSNPSQTKNMSPMLPLFLSGNTAKDPLMTMLLMAQQANPEINKSESTINLMQMLQMMSNSCDFGGLECRCNHKPRDLLMMQSLIRAMENRGEPVDLSPFMFMMWDPVPGCIGTLPDGDECICGTGGVENMVGANGQKRDNTLAKLFPYLIISGTSSDTLPDMGLIADAIIDPKGEAAGGFFSEMAMKQVLGDELGEIYSLDNGDFRADKLNEFVLAGMGLPDGLIPLLLSQPEDLTAPDRIQLFSWLNRGRRLTPSMISLIMGTTDASNVDLQQLYIESIVDNSKVDQLTAKMIEYVFEGGRKEDLMDLMFQSRNGFITEDSFEPDISILPKGIYPGQKLYYAHLETIGYDTCLLVDPVNRYPCGMQFGSDITPEQCASIPYCCFNPIDETRLVEDEEVQELLGDPNKGVDDIPLCYYNTFFIYYNQYSLEVQPFGNFPKPVDCPKLFRFGFNLEPDIWEYFQLTQKTSVLANDRISCGFPGITKFHCVAIRGCCYEEADIDVKCYLPLSRAEEATRIGDMDGSTVETDYQDMLGPIRAFAGDCNDNPYRIKDFYESRLSCNLRVDSLLYATAQRRSPLEEPNREECLSMGCCWEEDQSVLDEYPFISRCYRTERFGRESPKPALDVLKARSASFDDY